MDSDELPTIEDPEEAAWAAIERARVIEYLHVEGVLHGGISLEPRWYLSPFLAIWAVRSKLSQDRIGWWAISGDCPTDYVTSNHENDNADVLLSFAKQWKAAASEMSMGTQLTNYTVGPAGRETEFAPMLLSRAELLEKFAAEMKLEDSEDQ